MPVLEALWHHSMKLDGIPATANQWLMTEVLRNQWGFDGFVVTDYTGINEMIDHGFGNLQRSISILLLKQGLTWTW
jgi:beta-glucosidase